MSITWGSWEYSGGNGMRVGIEVVWDTPTHGTTVLDADVFVYTENQYTYSDNQTLTYGGSISGTQNFTNSSGGSQVQRDNVDYNYTYSGSSYGSSPSTKTFSASLSGAFNGVTPSVSVSSAVPARPYAAPAAPTGATSSRNSDTSTKVQWTNNATTGEPYTTQTLQRSVNGGSMATVSSSISGSAESYTDATVANTKYRHQIRATNSIGSSSYTVTGDVLTTPALPTNLLRSGLNGANQVLTWTNTAGYAANTDWATEVWRSNNGAAATLIGTVNGNAGSPATYTDTFPASNPSIRFKYQIRHKTLTGTQGTLYSAYTSFSTETSGTTSAPAAPTNLQPNAIVVDPTLAQNFTWTYNSTDASNQATVNIQHRLAGTSTWTVGATNFASVVAPGATGTWPLPVNTYLDGSQVEWQVQSKGADAAYGPWSASATYTNTVTVVTPDPIKYPLLMDLTTGDVEASSSAYDVRDFMMRSQSQMFGGGTRTVDASYGITWSARFIPIGFGRGITTLPGGYVDINNPVSYTVTNKALTSNVATLTFASHKIRAGETVIVSGVDATFNGTFVVRSATTTTITYDKVAANVTSVASGGNVGLRIQGHCGASDVVPTTAGVITLAAWCALYYEIPINWGGGTTARKNGVVAVTQKALTSNVATLTVVAPHYFAIGDSVVVAISDAVFDGQFAITAMTATSISYAKTNANVGTTAAAGYAKPFGQNTIFGNFHLVSYNGADFIPPSNWVFLAIRNNDAATVEWITGDSVDPGYDSNSPVLKQVILNSSTDVTGTAGNKPALRIGDIAAAHIRADGNELQAMTDDSTPGMYYLQQAGGGLRFGPDNLARSLQFNTAETTTSATPVALSTNQEVNIPKPNSGKLKVTLSGELKNVTAGNSTRLLFEINTAAAGGGTNVLAAADANGIASFNAQFNTCSRTIIVTPTNTGTTWYVRLMKKSGSGTTATIDSMTLVVEPVM